MALKDPPVTLKELAEAIGRPEKYLMRNWQKLNETHGLPRKLSIGWVWPRLATEAFLQGITEEQKPATGPTVTSVVANQNQALAARYAGGRA